MTSPARTIWTLDPTSVGTSRRTTSPAWRPAMAVVARPTRSPACRRVRSRWPSEPPAVRLKDGWAVVMFRIPADEGDCHDPRSPGEAGSFPGLRAHDDDGRSQHAAKLMT